MEEDIKILEEILNRDIEDTEGTKIMKKAIRNLIAGYKELEEKVKTLKSLSNDYNRLWIEKDDSDFNSLVLRLQRLNDTRHSYTNNIDIEIHNRNIEEMQNLLENFKIKTFEEV